MTAEIPEEVHVQSRKRKHFKGYRRLKVVLLVLGIAGLVLGLWLLGWHVLSGNVKLFNAGIIYILISLVVLGLRGIIVYFGQSRN